MRDNKTLESNNIEVINKDTEIVLNLHDKIGFLRRDFWFRLEQTNENQLIDQMNLEINTTVNNENGNEEFFQIDQPDDTTNNGSETNLPSFRIRNVDEINKMHNLKRKESSVNTESEVESSNEKRIKVESVDETGEKIASVVYEGATSSVPVIKDEPVFFDVINDITADRSGSTTPDIPDNAPSGSKTLDIPDNVSSGSNTPDIPNCDDPGNQPVIPVIPKPDNPGNQSNAPPLNSESDDFSDENNENVNTTSGPSPGPGPRPGSSTTAQKVKKEPADSTYPKRESCEFGIKCYR